MGAIGLLLKAVLQLQLGVCRKTITGRDIDPPEVLAPAHRFSAADIDLAEKLLVPAEGATGEAAGPAPPVPATGQYDRPKSRGPRRLRARSCHRPPPARYRTR